MNSRLMTIVMCGTVSLGLFLACLYATPVQAQPKAGSLTANIEAIEGQVSSIAVAPFKAPEGAPDLAAVIEADLLRTGYFKIVPRPAHPSAPSSPSVVEMEAWQKLGVDYLVIGAVPAPGAPLRFYFIDVRQASQLIAYDLPVSRPAALRSVAHQASDLILKKLTGVVGVADTRLAYVSQTGAASSTAFSIVISEADGSEGRVVAISRERLSSPAWSPDRRKLAFAGSEKGQKAIYVMEIATGQSRKLYQGPGDHASPSWSPDGRQIAFSSDFDGNSEIALIDANGGERHRLTESPAIDAEPDWSPDGASIVFTSDRGGKPQIWHVPVSGGEAVRISPEALTAYGACWAPDGNRLALVVGLDGGFQAATLNLGNGQLNSLGVGPADERPSWSPNGEFMLFATQKSGAIKMRAVSPGGRPVRWHYSSDAAISITSPAWSPNVPTR